MCYSLLTGGERATGVLTQSPGLVKTSIAECPGICPSTNVSPMKGRNAESAPEVGFKRYLCGVLLLMSSSGDVIWGILIIFSFSPDHVHFR